jgi:putative ABC transport system permease protein
MKTPTSLRIFRLLLWLYPREFRDAYGAHMEEAFLASLRRRAPGSGPASVLLTWVRVGWDTAVHAADLRIRRKGRVTDPPGGPASLDARRPWGRPTLGGLLSGTFQDLRFTLRALKKSPTFTVVVVFVAGFGITLTTLVFTTVNAAFLRPLPHVRNAEELVKVVRELPSRPGQRYGISYQDYLHLQEQSTTLYDLVGVIPYHELMLRAGSDMDRQIIGGEVTANYFQALGIPMVVGRGILPEDAESGNDVAVLGHATWMREYGGSPSVLGQTVRVDGRQHTIVGVAPPGLGWLSREPVESAVWIPLRARYKEAPDWYVLDVAGRRRDRVTLPQIQGEFDALASGLVASDPDRWTEDPGAVGLRVLTDRQARFDMGSPRGVASIIIYLVFVGLIMLITCSNVASLLLNRALRRRSEIAMRLALGAGRWRLVRSLLTESLVLFFLAGSLALLLIHWGTQLLAVGWGVSLPAVADITVDVRVAFFALGITVLSGLAFGLIPALQATSPDLAPALKGKGERQPSMRFGARNLFVLAQVAGSMVLVAVSALLVRDVQQAGTVDIGFDPRGMAVASLDLSQGEYGEEDGRLWLESLTERLRGIPGVEAVALSSWVPLSGSRWRHTIRPEGLEIGPDESLYTVYNAVTPGYFAMVGMPLLSGRDFEASDVADAPPVIVVNQAFARRYWPDQEPLGRRVSLREDEPAAEVVGVVRDAMYGLEDLRSREAEPHFWAPRAQLHHDPVQVHARVPGPMGPVLSAMREEIRLLDGDLPIINLTTMESLTGKALQEERAGATLFGGFSLLALFLAALGIYGVMAHAVMERTRELGVRLAVGAGPGRVVGMVLADSLRLSALGIGIGLILAVLVAMGIRALLVGVSVLDPFSLIGSVVVLTLAALLAGVPPAARAARLDPVLSLKSE